MNKEYQKKASEMAKASIYHDAEYLGTWNGYEVFEPVFDDDEVHYIGFPQFILCKDGKATWTQTVNQSQTIMAKFYPSE
ncbi:MAG: hypothetical protein ACI4AK_08455 [Lepagella sp.]